VALPDFEAFYAETGGIEMEDGEESEAGWYYWPCLPGCMPDSDPIGPFATEQEAIDDIRQFND
jgi:hypothetical protein